MTNVRPREDWVFVRKEGSWEEMDRAAATLILVEDRPNVEVGKVLSVGPGEFKKGERVPMEVGVGDRVIFKEFAGTDFGTVEAKDYVFLKQGEILAKVHDG